MFASGVETQNSDAEKFSAYSLETLGDIAKSEEILLYGIDEDSKYVDLDVSDSKVYVSSGYAEKYRVKSGDTITLKEKYEDEEYAFEIAGVYDYVGTLSVFMSKSKLNETFDLGKNYFCGYFSDTEITDIDEAYIGSVIDLEALTKLSRQLKVSMGNMMLLVNVFAAGMFMILIYLLSKIIIEKNGQSISMVKILGYTNREISQLYIQATTVMVILSLLVSIPLVRWALGYIFYVMMLESITGWFELYTAPSLYVEMFVIGILTYGVVAALEYRKIGKVPMDEALKNVE
jgi:putative ABC transport system permease protein